MDDGSLRGHLVVATPGLVDPNFAHTVVFMLDHSDVGGLGIVINRPSATPVGVALPPWEPLATHPAMVFVGGPVQPEAVVALDRSAASSSTLQPVIPGVGIVDLRAEPDTVGGEVDGVRLFAGYAGWGGGQLEDEIESGGWFVVTPEPDDVFADDPEALWVRVLSRQGGWFSTISADPTLN